MTATPTGRLDRRGTDDVLVLTRTFSAPIEDVWAAVTESERLARWIGRWTGDPSQGFVTFEMTAEGEDVPPSRYDIVVCDPPTHIAVNAVDDYGTWKLDLMLTEDAGVTTLTFAQVVDDLTMLENTGPGWDYYLDRLVAAETGGDPLAIDFERDYYPAMRDFYDSLASGATPG